jgi:hypothetical protein
MNVQSPLNINLIDLNNIKTIKTKIINNSKIIFLKYNNINFVIQLSNLSINNIIDSNVIEFNINNNNNNCISFFNKLDDHIINLAKINSNNWFNENNLEILQSIKYKRIVNENSTIKLKLCNNESLKTIISLNSQNINDFSNLLIDNLKTKIILEIYAIQIKSNIFNLILRPINILFLHYNLYNYKFIESDDDENSINNDDKNSINNNDNNDDDENSINNDDENSNDDNDNDNDDNDNDDENSNNNDDENSNDNDDDENSNDENSINMNDEYIDDNLFIKNILNNIENTSITTSTNSQN